MESNTMSKAALLSGFTGLVGVSALLAGSIEPAMAKTTIKLPASCAAVKLERPMTDLEIKACFTSLMLLIGQDRNVYINMGSSSSGGGGGKAGPAGAKGDQGNDGATGATG